MKMQNLIFMVITSLVLQASEPKAGQGAASGVTVHDMQYLSKTPLGKRNIAIKAEEMLAQERTTNMMVFNDVFDDVPGWILPDDFASIDSSAILMEFVFSLLEKQLVLCTKSLWISLQNTVQIWERYATESVDSLMTNYLDNIRKVDRDQVGLWDKFLLHTFGRSDLREIIMQYSELIKKNDARYKEIQKIVNQGNTDLLKSLLEEYSQESENDYTKVVDQEKTNIDALFAAYISYQVILAHGYICKQVNDDFILFIPKNLLLTGQSVAVQENFLGLSFSKLHPYFYRNIQSLSKQDEVFARATNLGKNNTLGKSLLDALQKLKIDHNNVIQANENYQQPFFNIFISGHGDEKITAEISIELHEDSKIKQQTSDMLNILKFLGNSFRMKSLSFVSCYPGGKKLLDTFDIKNPLSSIHLSSVNYPIIFIGSFYATTFVKVHIDKIFKDSKYQLLNNHYIPKNIVDQFYFKAYFDYINQTPSNYVQAAQVLLNNDDDHGNKASIKMPNTEWFVSVDLIDIKQHEKNKNVMQISQIDALAKLVIHVSWNINHIWLKANNINTIQIASLNFPAFLPINNNNQNYCIQKIENKNLWTRAHPCSENSVEDLFLDDFENWKNDQLMSLNNQSFTDVQNFSEQHNVDLQDIKLILNGLLEELKRRNNITSLVNLQFVDLHDIKIILNGLLDELQRRNNIKSLMDLQSDIDQLKIVLGDLSTKYKNLSPHIIDKYKNLLINFEYKYYEKWDHLRQAYFSTVMQYLMSYFFSINDILEPINIIIKELETKNDKFKNIYIFMNKKFVIKRRFRSDIEEFKNGYIYTDSAGQTKIVSWQQDVDTYPMDVEEQPYDLQTLLYEIDRIEAKAKASLEQYGEHQTLEKRLAKVLTKRQPKEASGEASAGIE